MTDREKVIKGLEDSLANLGCGYMDGVGELYAVSGENLQNAIALLKEQEAVEPLFNERMKWFVCTNCSLVLDEMRDDYCPSCGKRIAWNEYYLHEDETESR